MQEKVYWGQELLERLLLLSLQGFPQFGCAVHTIVHAKQK